MENRVHSIVKANEEWIQMESGFSLHACYIEENNYFWKQGWVDIVAKAFKERGLRISGAINLTPVVMGNRTIIEYALKFMKNKLVKKQSQMLRDLNSVRMSKRMLLPFKLVGIDGGLMTNT